MDKLFNESEHSQIINDIEQVELESLNAVETWQQDRAVTETDVAYQREKFSDILLERHNRSEAEKAATFVDVVTKMPKSFWLNMKHTGLSLGKFLFDVVDYLDDPKDFDQQKETQNVLGDELYRKKLVGDLNTSRGGEALQAITKMRLQEDIKSNIQEQIEAAPKNLKGFNWLVFNGSMAIARQLPILAASALTGGGASATSTASFTSKLFGTFSSAAASLSSMEAVDKYGELVASGVDERRAMVVASLYGGISYYAEKIPLERMLNPATNKGISNMFKTIGGEVLAENITELGHMSVDMGLLDESYSVGDLMTRIKDTTVLTAFTTPLLNLGTRPAVRISENMKAKAKYSTILSEMEQYNRDYQNIPVVGGQVPGKKLDVDVANINGKKIPLTDLPLTDDVLTRMKEMGIDISEDINIKTYDRTPEGVQFYNTTTETPNMENVPADIVAKIKAAKLELEQPEVSTERKQQDFINGTFTVSMVSDIKNEQIDVLLDMDKEMLTIRDLANIDLPDYVTPELVEQARTNVVNDLVDKGISDIDNHPKINLLDNIDKRLSMRDRDVARYRSENNKTVDENVKDITGVYDDIKARSTDIYGKVERLADYDIELKRIEDDDTQTEKYNDLLDKRNDLANKIDDELDKVVDMRKSARKQFENMNKNRRLRIDNVSRAKLVNMFTDSNKIIEDINAEIEAESELADTPLEDIETPERDFVESVIAETREGMWKQKNELVTDILKEYDNQRKFVKTLNETKAKRVETAMRNKIDESKTHTQKLIDGLAFDTSPIVDRLNTVDMPDVVREPIEKSLDRVYNTMQSIRDRSEWLSTQMEQLTQTGSDTVVDDVIDKMRDDMTQYSIELASLVDNVNDSILEAKTKFEISSEFMEKRPDMRDKTRFRKVFHELDFNLQMFATGNETTSQIEQNIKKLKRQAKDVSKKTGITFDNLSNFIDMFRSSLELEIKNNEGMYETKAIRQPKKHFFNPAQKLGNMFKQIYHVKNDTVQAYVEGMDMTKVERAKIENETLRIGNQFLKLDKDIKTFLLNNFMIPSARMNTKFTKQQFKNIYKNLDTDIDIDLLYQAYESYGNMMSFLADTLADKQEHRDPGMAAILRKNKAKYYVPLRRKPGVGKIIVRAKDDSDIVYFYNEYGSRREMEQAYADLKSGKQKVFRDMRNKKGEIILGQEIDLSTPIGQNFEIITEMSDTSDVLKKYARDMLGIFPDSARFNKSDFEKYADLSDDMSNIIDQSVRGLVAKYGDASNPDALSKQIKEKLLKLYRKQSAIGGFFIPKKGVAGYDVENIMREIDNTVNKTVSAASRFEMLDFHTRFMDNLPTTVPPDIKQYIKDYYKANIDNPDIWNQLAAKMSYANILYHIGGNITTTLKNYISAPLLNVLTAGETGSSATTVAKYQIQNAPRVAKFSTLYAKYIKNNKGVLFGELSHGESVDALTQMARESGFTPAEVDFIEDAFNKNYIDAGITTEFQRRFSNNGSTFDKVSSMLMVPFKISEVGVRLHSILTSAQAMQAANKGTTLNEHLYKAYTLTNKVQPSGGAYARIGLANKGGAIGAAARVSTSLMGFLFNVGWTSLDVSKKSMGEILEFARSGGKVKNFNHTSGLAFFTTGMMLLGGLRSMPYSDELREIYRSMFNEPDPISRLDAGESELGKFIANGAMKYLYIDIPGLAWGVPITTDLLKGGATGSMVYRVAKGASGAIKAGFDGNWVDVYKNVEYGSPVLLKRLMRAARLATYGYETGSGIRLTDESGEIKRMGAAEALTSLTGVQLRTKNYSDYKMSWVKNDIKANYNAAKSSVVLGIRRALQSGDTKKANSLARKFNKQLKWYYDKYKEIPVSPISKVTIQRVDE